MKVKNVFMCPLLIKKEGNGRLLMCSLVLFHFNVVMMTKPAYVTTVTYGIRLIRFSKYSLTRIAYARTRVQPYVMIKS